MKICLAQMRSVVGDVESNIKRHKLFIEQATLRHADFVVFPELSLTGYDPKIAKQLASDQTDARFEVFQNLSDAHSLTIGIGMAIKATDGVRIGMIFFQPRETPQTYCKQFLHSDETPYFVAGSEQLILSIGTEKIVPAICYEATLPEHSERALQSGANFYLASVAKTAAGVEKAAKHFANVARKYSVTVAMVNALGRSDNFESGGESAVWNDRGELIGRLDGERDGLLIFDSVNRELIASNNVDSMR